MSTQVLSNELYRQRDAISALHAWVSSIFDASLDHASQLESAAGQFQHMKTQLADFEQTVSTGLSEAEGKLQQAFTDMKKLVDETKGLNDGAGRVLEGKIMMMENTLTQLNIRVAAGAMQAHA